MQPFLLSEFKFCWQEREGLLVPCHQKREMDSRN